MKVYELIHSWNFANGEEGRYELRFTNLDDAKAKFLYLQCCIETDDYEFNPLVESYDGEDELTYSLCENKNDLVNRQDLILRVLEVQTNA